ncbi:MAG: methionine--tRNA ligase [Elusimicrobia bacterium RIFOXYB2_FULL_50_12]|nr:MAG: methionine--tRNA ligase [Elusimicrobia bacterium RIFOXYB2_FULL_50_12]
MKYYITTPIYYVNDTPHIGHAYTTVAADVMARWQRIHGRDVYFLTGTDEHGAKIAQAAAKAGKTPLEFCNAISGEFMAAWKALDITNTSFIRTTDPRHESAVRLFLQKLHDSGAIYKKKYEGLYCVACEKFIAPQDLNEDLCCPDHRQKPVTQSEENYFFRLSAYRERLLESIKNGHIEILPAERRNEIIGKLDAQPLEDISISRATLEWGIPLPFDSSQTAYVWVDALLNYITALGFETDSEDYRKFWPADTHLMAKDILWFHCVIWPAMLLAGGIPLPGRIFAHGFFTINGQKMSKSIGNVIRPADLTTRFGVDATRYLILSLFPFGADGDISWENLTGRYNSDLANNLGNLVNRTLDMLEKFSAKTIPAPDHATYPSETSGLMLSQLAGAEDALEQFEFHRYIQLLQSAIDLANRHIQNTAPWKMAKENNPALPTVLFNLAAHLRIIALYLYPFMPKTAAGIWQQLGAPEPLETAATGFFCAGTEKDSLVLPAAGTATSKGGIMFPRIK